MKDEIWHLEPFVIPSAVFGVSFVFFDMYYKPVH